MSYTLFRGKLQRKLFRGFSPHFAFYRVQILRDPSVEFRALRVPSFPLNKEKERFLWN